MFSQKHICSTIRSPSSSKNQPATRSILTSGRNASTGRPDGGHGDGHHRGVQGSRQDGRTQWVIEADQSSLELNNDHGLMLVLVNTSTWVSLFNQLNENPNKTLYQYMAINVCSLTITIVAYLCSILQESWNPVFELIIVHVNWSHRKSITNCKKNVYTYVF